MLNIKLEIPSIDVGNAATSFKTVIDIGTMAAQLGLNYKDTPQIKLAGKLAVISGRATLEIEADDWEIVVGGAADILFVGNSLIWDFKNEEGMTKPEDGIGKSFILRIKPPQ